MTELATLKQMKKEIKKTKIDFVNNNIKKDDKLTKKQKKFESKNLISKRALWTEKLCEFYDGQIKYPIVNDIHNEDDKLILFDKIYKSTEDYSRAKFVREIVILQDRLDQCLKELKELNINLKLTNSYNRNIYTIKRLDNIINIIKGEQKDDN